jgi:hypothetical protein
VSRIGKPLLVSFLNGENLLPKVLCHVGHQLNAIGGASGDEL